jgi:hypothetical protein
MQGLSTGPPPVATSSGYKYSLSIQRLQSFTSYWFKILTVTQYCNLQCVPLVRRSYVKLWRVAEKKMFWAKYPWAGGVAQVVEHLQGPEFKPQYHTHRNQHPFMIKTQKPKTN